MSSSMNYIPPWREPYFIGITGCSGSGKTTMTSNLIRRLNVPWTVLLSMDNFYRPLSAEDREQAFQSKFDFDCPDCIDFNLLYDVLIRLKRGEKTDIPIYDFKEHDRTKKVSTLYGANVVVVEGIYALYDPRILNILDLKIFVQEDYDVCMARRLHRDILYRGRQLDLSIQQWEQFVKPNYLTHILPTQKRADMLIPRGIENQVALDVLYLHVKQMLQRKSRQHLEELRRLGILSGVKPLVTQLEQSNQVRALITMIKSRFTSREDFVFAVDRIANRLVSLALDESFSDLATTTSMVTPQGYDYTGTNLPFDHICAVTMVRGGECFEHALKASIPTIFLGRLLIQSDNHTGEPKLHTARLPRWMGRESRHKVLITEAQILSGAAMVMALAVLVDHGIRQDDIVMITLWASEIAVRRISAAFPHVHQIVGCLEPGMSSLELDTRYFGT